MQKINEKGSKIERLRKETEKLRRENGELKRELKEFKKEFEEYKKRHPETAGVKHGKPYSFRASAESGRPKKLGARKGHKAHFRLKPKWADEVRHLPVLRCPICGGTGLSEEAQERGERIVEDIVIPKPLVTKIILDRRYCRHCKKLVESPVLIALPGARLGIRIMLVVVWLKIKLRLTEEAIPELLEKLFGIKISEGEVINILAQVAGAFDPYHEQLIQEIRDAPARHIDETSWRIDGKNVWLWAFVTKGEALYKIASSRSHEVPLEVLGKGHNGVDIHDRFSAYKTRARKTRNPQQECWAHLVNDAKELAQFYGEEGEHIHQTIKKTYGCAKAFNHKGTDADIEKLFQSLADELNRPYKSHHCYKFVVNLLKEKDNLFEFVKNPEVDRTNNIAERYLRHSVIARKIGGGNRSTRGAIIYERLLSIIHTLHVRDQDLLEYGPKILLTSDD